MYNRYSINNTIRISVITSLYKCNRYIDQYFKHVKKISNLKECEFIFIHNEPNYLETNKIKHHLSSITDLNYLYLPIKREGLYKSWNRGIYNAKGEYIAVWNVDDIRFPDSLFIQANALEDCTDAGLVYGNKLVSNSQDDNEPRLHKPLDISKNKRLKPFKDGSLIMWKRSVHDSVGYFDEQFVTAGDQEMWYRIGKKYNIIKVNHILGNYLEHDDSLGHKKSGRGENIVIGLRYGFYKIKNVRLLFNCLNNYSITRYKKNDKYYKIKHIGWDYAIVVKTIIEIIKYVVHKNINTIKNIYNSKWT